MSIDEQAREFVDRIERDPAAFRSAASPAELGFRELEVPDVEVVSDFLVPGAPPVPTRVFIPHALPPPRRALVWLHPGGFTGGSVDDIDAICRVLAEKGRCVVLSPSYRLAPENPYPAALRDVENMMGWLAANTAVFGIDTQRVAIGGQSAGATLAASYSLIARSAWTPALQILCYSILDPRLEGASYLKNAEGYAFTAAEMEEDWRLYLGDDGGSIPEPAAPLLVDSLIGAPPALIVAAGCDPARDDSRRYAERLTAAGTDVTLLEYPGTIHAFLSFAGALDSAEEALAAISATLRARLPSDAPRLQHTTIPYPPGAAACARTFYGEIVGLGEKQVPEALSGNGFIWFHAGPFETELHLIPEEGIDSRSLRHACLAVEELSALESRLRTGGYALERHELMPGRPQVFVRDPFGNLLEIMSSNAAAVGEADQRRL